MITVTKQENGVLFTFQDSDKYLYGSGTILVPFNSLSIIQDESDMITLRKSASYDIFLSARYDTDLGYRSKEEAVEALKGMLYDEAGISEEEVQSMIDAATSGMPSSQVVEQLRTDINTVSGTVSSHTADTTVHFTGAQKSNYDGLEAQYYVDDNWDVMPMSVFNDFTNDYSAAMGQFDQRISANTSAIATKADTSAVTAVANDVQTVSGQVQTKVATSDFNTYTAATATALGNKQDKLQFYGEDTEQWEEKADEDSDITAVFTMKQSDIYMDVSGDEGSSAAGVQTRIDARVDNGVLNTGKTGSFVDIYANEASNDTEYASSINVNQKGVGINTSFTDTNAEFGESLASIDMNNNDVSISLESTANGDSTVMTINTSGVTINDERVLTEGDVTSSITSGSTDSEIPTAKATYDAIQAGGGGGATYSAGTNISIDSANTINCTLPMRTYNNTSIEGGANNYIGSQNFSFAYGRYNNFAISGNYYGIALGFGNIVSNSYQCSVGYTAKSNRDSSTFGSSGNTLFAVGNGGEGEQVRHNAFEIMQNGDLYFADTDNTAYSKFNQKPLVRLQDMYGALGGLKLVKLTQAEYDALATKDANTLYIISNVVS